jgi:hypothetical protein
MQSSFLKIGDYVCLYSEAGKGYLNTLGFNHPNFSVQGLHDKKLAIVPNQRNFVFRVLPKLNYNVAREYAKLQKKLNQLSKETPDKDDDQAEEILKTQKNRM